MRSKKIQLLVLRLHNSYVALIAFCCGVSMLLFAPALPSNHLTTLIAATSVILSVKWRVLVPFAFMLFGLAWANYWFTQHHAVGFPAQYERVDFSALGSIEGLVSERNGNYQFHFRVKEIDAAFPQRLLGTKLKLSCYRCLFAIETNQVWRFTLRVKRPRGYASWGAFDYEKYLYRNRVVAKGYVRTKGENTLISSEQRAWSSWRQAVRQSLVRKAENSVGLNMILALAVGDKSGFSSHQRQVLQKTGTSHLMAISGLHVGLVFMFVSALCRVMLWPVARIFEYIPRPTLVMFPALASAILYSALAGFAVSTQRALTMLLVFVVCRLIAREIGLFKVLLIAMSALLLFDPFSVMDIGFWLSCGAVLVIAVVSAPAAMSAPAAIHAPAAQPTKRIADQRLAKTSLLKLQPMLWLGMLPITISFFGQVSFIAPMVNLVLVPLFCALLVPLTLAGVCIDALGFESLATWWISNLSTVFNSLYLMLDWLSELKIANGYTTPLVWWQWGLFLSAVVFYIIKPRLSVPWWMLFTVSAFQNISTAIQVDELQLTLLDVGQGLAIVIETPNTVTVYDTGPKYGSGFTAADAVLLPFLRYRGIQRIDTLIISHADNDHIGGYQSVIDAFDVGEVITSRVDKIPIARACQAGDAWHADQTHMSVLSPEPDTPKGSNNLSCVLMLEHLGTRILLSGDIEKQVERYLVANYPSQLAANILLVPHQGSKTSSTAKFLDAVAPDMAMLAAGYKNHYGHPHASVVERYRSRAVDLYSTIDSGSILLKINAQGWQVLEFRQARRRFWHYQKVPQQALLFGRLSD